MLAKDVKRGEMVRKVFDLGEVKDYSYKDEATGEIVKRQKFIITSNRRDRDRDIVDPAGAMVDDYANNPVMLWAHQYDQMPIAKSVEMTRFEKAVQVKDGSTEVRQQIAALVTYVPDKVYPKGWTGITGSMVHAMYDLGFLNAVSIGFDPWDWEEIEEKDGRKESQFDDIFGTGTRFKSWDMLEFSAVPVPSNPEALVDRKMRKMFMKSLRSWATETIKECDACAAKGNHTREIEKQEAEAFLRNEGETMEKNITDTDKSDLTAAIGKENLQDLSAYHRRLHQQAAQDNVLTGFSQGDMNWLHAQIEGKMCDLHKAQDPPTKCADPSPLEWGKDAGAEVIKDGLLAKCSHITEVTGRIADRERGSGKTVSEAETEKAAATKQGRVLSGKNEQDLRDAVDHHTAGVKLVNNVLGQVTGTPTQGSSAEPPTSWDYDAEGNQGGAGEAGSGAAADPGITKAHVNTGDCLGCPNFDDANVVCRQNLDPATCGLANLYNEGLKSMTEEKAPTAPNPGDCGNCTGDHFGGGKCDVGKSPDSCGMTGAKAASPIQVIGEAIGKAVVKYLNDAKAAEDKTVTNESTDDELFEIDEDMLNDVLTTEFGLDSTGQAEE